jgi:membrane-associated phospholipid phosphatase
MINIKHPTAVLCTAFCCITHAQVIATPDRFGDAARLVLPVAAAAVGVRVGDSEGLKELGYSILLAQGGTTALKQLVRSPRPDGTGLGFPSGHASLAFASAGFVHRRYGLLQALPLYGLAGLTAYSRVRTHHHFTKDVVGGAVVGTASSLLLTRPVGERAIAAVGYNSGGVKFIYSRSW